MPQFTAGTTAAAVMDRPSVFTPKATYAALAPASSATANTYGSYVECHAASAVADPCYLTALTVQFNFNDPDQIFNVTIATGGAGSETDIGTYSGVTGIQDEIQVIDLRFLKVTGAPRIAVRVKDDVASALSYNVSLMRVE